VKDISGADKLKPTQLDQVIQPTDSVQALSESLLALSKHLVNRIDVIRAARQQAAYHTALSRTPEADPVLLRTLQRRCFKRHTSTAPSPTVFYAVRLGHVPGIYTSWREAQPQTVGIPADVKRFSPPGRKLRNIWQSLRALRILGSMILRHSSLLTARPSPPGLLAGGSTSPPREEPPPGRYGAPCPRPPLTLIGSALGEPLQHRRTQRHVLRP